jgi:cbb3-type cytochrome oxidase subunit 3
MSILLWLEHYSIVLVVLVFLAIVVSTYWPGRKSKIEQQGQIPLKDDV